MLKRPVEQGWGGIEPEARDKIQGWSGSKSANYYKRNSGF